MINILEYVIDPIMLLQKASGSLNKGGVILVHFTNAMAINRRLAVLMGTLKECEELSPFDIEVAGLRRIYSIASLCADVLKAGLKYICYAGGVFYKMLSKAQMDWFLKCGLWKGWWFRLGSSRWPQKGWKAEFCRASYELGKEHPEGV